MKITHDVNRRDFLKLSGISAAGLVVAACGGAPAAGSEHRRQRLAAKRGAARLQ